VLYHIFQEQRGLLNLPRVVYVKKSWTLRELHIRFFETVKDLMIRWLKDYKDDEASSRCRQDPKYKNPDTGEALTYDDFVRMDAEKQFASFFPNLTEDNWKETLSKRNFELEDMPY